MSLVPNPTPHVSVALATYQGERFLAEQLASIARQTLPPGELVVCDDASQDRTRALLADFAARAPFPVRVVENEHRQKTNATFSRALGLCTGEIIALCDQDDVWLPQKLECLAAAFQAQPALSLAFSNAERIDALGACLPEDLWQVIEFDARARSEFSAGRAVPVLLRRYAVTGATMAFRARDLAWLLPIPQGWVHDAWLALLLAATGPVAAIDERLIQYRQHAGQQIGASRRSFREQVRRAAATKADDFMHLAYNFASAAQRLAAHAGRLTDRAILSQLEEKVAFCRARAKLRFTAGSRWSSVWHEFAAGRYRRFARGWQSVLHDLLL